MKKRVFNIIQQSIINSSSFKFYLPDTINHPFIHELTLFEQELPELQKKVISSRNELELKHACNAFNKKFQKLNELSKKDFPDLNYFIDSLMKNDFNFDYLKNNKEQIYSHLSFIQKFKSKIFIEPTVSLNKQLNENIKQQLFNELGFKYIFIPFKSISEHDINETFNNFILNSKLVTKKINQNDKAISINGHLGIHLESGNCALYGHATKSIGIIPNITQNSILHELTHAVDNYIFQQLSGINEYASENKSDFVVKNVNFLPAYKAIKQTLWNVCNESNEFPDNIHQVKGKKASTYLINCIVADQELFIEMNKEYYQHPCEILARLVESGEYSKETQEANKILDNCVYLQNNHNPYSKLKFIFFSHLEQPNNILNIRKTNTLIQSNKPV